MPALSNVLFVDDDENLLQALRRSLRKSYAITTATSGQAALDLITDNPPYEVIVSDMRMPQMDGLEFFKEVRLVSPDSTRIMLTGNNDADTAKRAVNEGHVYHFLNKPCKAEELTQAVQAGLEHRQRILAERELLEQTVTGCIHLMTDLMDLSDTGGQDKANPVLVAECKWLSAKIGFTAFWQIDMALKLRDIGNFCLPPDLRIKLYNKAILSKDEQAIITDLPNMSAMLVANIPRMEPVANTIQWHQKYYDGTGSPEGSTSGDDLPLGSRIIRIIEDLVELEQEGVNRQDAYQNIQRKEGLYDPLLVQALYERWGVSSANAASEKIAAQKRCEISAADIKPGMRVLEDITMLPSGVLLSAGTIINNSQIPRLINFARLGKLREPLIVNRNPQE